MEKFSEFMPIDRFYINILYVFSNGILATPKVDIPLVEIFYVNTGTGAPEKVGWLVHFLVRCV